MNERKDWLANLEVGDEVCFTNIEDTSARNALESMMNKMMKSDKTEENFCYILPVRTLLSNGDIVAGDVVFDSDGVPKISNYDIRCGHILEPDDNLRELANRMKLVYIIDNVDFSKVPTDYLMKIVDILEKANKEVGKQVEKSHQPEHFNNSDEEDDDDDIPNIFDIIDNL